MRVLVKIAGKDALGECCSANMCLLGKIAKKICTKMLMNYHEIKKQNKTNNHK